MKTPLTILSLFICFASIGKAAGETGITDLSMSLVKMVPGQFGKAINTYLETMRPQDYRAEGGDQAVQASNTGLINHFKSEMNENACFKLLAKKFYSSDEIANDNVSLEVRPHPTLKSSVSDLKNPLFEPGWLWKKAMALTGNNANLAMKIIAYCGHDDTFQSEKEFLFSKKNTDEITCPLSNSAMYFPESLAKGVDTSSEVKKLVMDTQSIHIAPDKIRAKTYHIYGAAYLACRMIENGVSPESVAKYSQKFAYIYRRIRTCRVAAESMERLSNAEAKYESVLRDFIRSLKSGVQPTLESELNKTLSSYSQDPLLQEYLKSGNLPYKEFEKRNMDPFVARLTRRYAKTEDKEKFVKRLVSEYYASKTYFKLTNCPNGSASEMGEALKANSANLNNLDKDSLYLPENFDEQCSALSSGHCAEAKKVLDTWDADFKWTMNQHKVGAEFAAKNCKPLSQQKTPPLCQQENSQSNPTKSNTSPGTK